MAPATTTARPRVVLSEGTSIQLRHATELFKEIDHYATTDLLAFFTRLEKIVRASLEKEWSVYRDELASQEEIERFKRFQATIKSIKVPASAIDGTEEEILLYLQNYAIHEDLRFAAEILGRCSVVVSNEKVWGYAKPILDTGVRIVNELMKAKPELEVAHPGLMFALSTRLQGLLPFADLCRAGSIKERHPFQRHYNQWIEATTSEEKLSRQPSRDTSVSSTAFGTK